MLRTNTWHRYLVTQNRSIKRSNLTKAFPDYNQAYFQEVTKIKNEKKLYTCANSPSISAGYKGVKFIYSSEMA